MSVVPPRPERLEHAPLEADANPAGAGALDLGSGPILLAVGETPVQVDDEAGLGGMSRARGREQRKEESDEREAATHTLVVGRRDQASITRSSHRRHPFGVEATG